MSQPRQDRRAFLLTRKAHLEKKRAEAVEKAAEPLEKARALRCAIAGWDDAEIARLMGWTSSSTRSTRFYDSRLRRIDRQLADLDGIDGAILSPCGTYRYRLWRYIPDHENKTNRRICWIMLNPSTADASEDDPTVRRIAGYSKDWGFRRFDIVNVYGIRGADPSVIRSHPDPVGPDNDDHVVEAMEEAQQVVCAWGTKADPKRLTTFVQLLEHEAPWVLKLTKDGHPGHPLYLKKDADPFPWGPPEDYP